MKPIIFIFLSVPFVQTRAQTEALAEISNQVWKPFIQSFNSWDTDGFMAVHSKEVFRVPQESNRLMNWDDYHHSTQNGNHESKDLNRSRTIELRFLQRLVNVKQAFESGYFKVTVVRGDGKSNAFYGKFLVLHRKEDGTWKILLDTDAPEDVTEEVFLSGRPLE